MQSLLRLSGLIDRINHLFGRLTLWLVLISVLISAGNATVRKAFDISSNAWLEIQWYLFAGVFLLGSAYTFLHNEHVRIDVISGRFSARGRAKIDIFGILVFLLPFVGLVTVLSWPFFVKAFVSGEMSNNAGGLIRWPAYLLMPLGFGLLFLQGISELIKRIAFLQGLIPDPLIKESDRNAEAELAEAILREQEKKEAAERAAGGVRS